MDLYLSPKHLLVICLLSLATFCCKAQQADSVQIVARAALCFDNQTVTNGCMRWMRRISNRTVTTNRFCNTPCYGQMMLVLNCVDGVLTNFQFYSPGLMQGVQSIFQMSCGGRTSNNINTSTSGNMVAETIEAKVDQIFKP
ncbi:hypothetical protein M5K25_002038 [Dendrobium thyrsiflorum]|uniref:DUF7731 domain-containing protein n=1 Tax=Dendrobium thyrsiflorum TaxID=117978 RepID=A0ABD0VRY9_DENTH